MAPWLRFQKGLIAFSLSIFLMLSWSVQAQDKTFSYATVSFSNGTSTVLLANEVVSKLAVNADNSVLLGGVTLNQDIVTLVKSTDNGATWQRISVPDLSNALGSPSNRESITQFEFLNGKFYLLVQQWDNSMYNLNISRLFSSSDGTTWTEVTDANFKSSTFYNHLYPNPNTYSNIEKIVFGNGKFLALATEYILDNARYKATKTKRMESTDGLTWSSPLELFTNYRDGNGHTNIFGYKDLSYTAAGFIFFQGNDQFVSSDF
jgi:hypothetical protein